MTRIVATTVSRFVLPVAIAVLAGGCGDVAFDPAENGSAYMHASAANTVFIGRFGLSATVAQGLLTITATNASGSTIDLVVLEHLVNKTDVNGAQEILVRSDNWSTVGFARYSQKIGDLTYPYSTGTGGGVSNGSITITRYTETKVQGTFSFTACVPTGIDNVLPCVTVENGEFNVSVSR